MPIAFFAGVKLIKITREKCMVSVPYKWLSQNPFRSVYFAAQSMAAEMSTGAICMLAIQGCEPPVSMLVVNMQATFYKKAAERIYFTCEDGQIILSAVEKAIASGEGISISAQSTGKLKDGTVVSNFIFTWSFKLKNTK